MWEGGVIVSVLIVTPIDQNRLCLLIPNRKSIFGPKKGGQKRKTPPDGAPYDRKNAPNPRNLIGKREFDPQIGAPKSQYPVDNSSEDSDFPTGVPTNLRGVTPPSHTVAPVPPISVHLQTPIGVSPPRQPDTKGKKTINSVPIAPNAKSTTAPVVYRRSFLKTVDGGCKPPGSDN